MAIYKLGDICNYVEGYTNPPINNEEFFGGNKINWMRVKDLKHGSKIIGTELNLSKKGFNLIKNKNQQIFLKNSIVWSKSGTIGNVGILKINVCANRGILNILPKKNIYNQYLYYILLKNKKKFQNLATGAVLKHFYGPNLMNFKISLINKKIQKQIIDIIEPHENLFLKYYKCVRINKIQNTKNDIKNLIDIIEPIEKIENCTYNLIQNLLKLVSKIKNNKNIFKLSNVSELIKNKPKNLQQVSAKVLNKRVSFINEIENINTYKTNIFYCKKNTLLINTIRTYLEKWSILPIEANVNGTLAQIFVNKKQTAIINNLMNNNFWNQANRFSKGTKMPVLSKKDLLNNILFYDVEFEIKNIFDFLTKLNKIILILKMLKNKLIFILIR